MRLRLLLSLCALHVVAQVTAQHCSENFFDCLNGKCVAKFFECDDHNDCGNFQDELNCVANNKTNPAVAISCPDGLFACNDELHICIPDPSVCDGMKECSNGADEANCTVSKMNCGADFTCEDLSRCVQKIALCDGVLDCTDGSDERNCTTVKENPNIVCDKEHGHFQCNDGKCIEYNKVCDGKPDCSTAIDESKKAGCRNATFYSSTSQGLNDYISYLPYIVPAFITATIIITITVWLLKRRNARSAINDFELRAGAGSMHIRAEVHAHPSSTAEVHTHPSSTPSDDSLPSYGTAMTAGPSTAVGSIPLSDAAQRTNEAADHLLARPSLARALTPPSLISSPDVAQSNEAAGHNKPQSSTETGAPDAAAATVENKEPVKSEETVKDATEVAEEKTEQRLAEAGKTEAENPPNGGAEPAKETEAK